MSSTPQVPRAPGLTLELPAGAPGEVDLVAWRATVATIAAWPAFAVVQPAIERRLERRRRSGPLRDIVHAQVIDPLGIAHPDEVGFDLDELVRPLRRHRALRELSGAAAAAPTLTYDAVWRHVEPEAPNGGLALSEVLVDLRDGLAALPGPVALSLRVTPAPPEHEDDEQDGAVRGVRLTLRLAATVPLPLSLHARAEALCLGRRATAATWARPQGDHGPGDSVLPGVAALALGAGVGVGSTAEGRPADGPLSTAGALLGRVRRTSGRPTGWRLPWEARRHHALVVGASGSGKTTTLLRLALDDLAAGRTVVVFDPHGDLAADVQAAAGPEGFVGIDPRDPLTAPLDLLDADPLRAASHLTAAVGEVWPAEFSGPVWQRGIVLALRVLAARPEGRRTTLAELERYLVDPAWRLNTLRVLPPGPLRDQATHEASTWATVSASSDTSIVSWLAGKLTPLTQGPAATLFDRSPGASLEERLDTARAMVITLPVGLLGGDTAGLAARMALTRLTTALAARTARPLADRSPVSIILDEAHVVAGPALSGLLAQARKFGAGVTVATQTPSQLGRHLPAILTNTQTLLLGRLAAAEAATLRGRVGDTTLRVLPTLPRHHLVAVGEGDAADVPPLVLTPTAVPPLPTTQERSLARRQQLLARLATDLTTIAGRRAAS